jgi:hypothetical protein
METFHQFWDKINGKMYQDIPPPVKYDFAKYIDSITSGPVNGTEENSSSELRTITMDDMARYAAVDVEDWFKKHGKNLNKLGPQMTDAELKTHYGHTW